MIVIHPTDRTTAFLSKLYEGVEGAVVIKDNLSNKEMNHILHHTPKNERILLLGHGCYKGLYWRENDTQPEFDDIVVGHPHNYHLRNHGSNIVAVFCHADKFAENERLHGLFTGMIISEMSEAEAEGIETTEEEINRENQKFVTRLRSLLDEKVPLHEIPMRMRDMDDVHSPLTTFNYQRIYYM